MSIRTKDLINKTFADSESANIFFSERSTFGKAFQFIYRLETEPDNVYYIDETIGDAILLNGGGGGSSAGSSNQIQINQSGAFFADSTFQKSDTDFNVGLDHTQQSAVTFTGSGLDDLEILVNSFSGTYPTTYTVTVVGLNKDVLDVETGSTTGGTFNIGDTIVNGLGASATIDAISYTPDGMTVLVLSSLTGSFSPLDSVSNGLGVSSIVDVQEVRDTISWTDGTTTIPETTFFASNSIAGRLSAETGHTLSDSWTWDYTSVNQNILDFSNNDYKFQSTFGTGTFGYRISDNLLGLGYEGSAMTLSDGSGNSGFRGLYIETAKGDIFVADNITLSDGTIVENKIDISSTASVTSAYNGTSFLTGTSVIASDYINIYNDVGAGNELGLFVESGALLLGNRNGGNNTKITIDDVNEHITISNLPAYDDDTAAGVGGLTAGMVYMTTGSGSAPLNAAGILMIKQ